MSFLDLTNVQPQSGKFAPIPAGRYFVIVDESELRTSAKGGEYVNVKFKILGGQYDGKYLFHMFTTKNENALAVSIGLSNLRSFMECAGVTNFKLENVLDLIGLRCDAVTKIKTDKEYGDKAVISFFDKHETPATNDIPF